MMKIEQRARTLRSWEEDLMPSEMDPQELLKEIQERIRQEQERLARIQRATEQLRMLENDIHTAQHYFKFVERRAKQIAEAAEKEL